MSLITRESAIILHFHAERKVNPDDPTDIEWIEKKPVVMILDDFTDPSEVLEYLLETMGEVECMIRADYVTHERGA
jgi:hypothetical protein